MYCELVGDLGARQAELLVGLLVHEVRLVAVVVEELDVLRLRVHAGELLAGAEGVVDHGAGLEILELGAHEGATLARLHVLEVDDPPHRTAVLDVHPGLELVRGDHVGHDAREGSCSGGSRCFNAPWLPGAQRSASRRLAGSRSAPRLSTARRRRPRDGAAARVPPARPDRHRGDAAGARALEPARRLRPQRARPAALGGAGAVRVERLHLADRVAADGPRPDAPSADVDPLRARALDARLHGGEPVVPALRHARARAARPAALARARRPRRGRAARPPLVRRAARRPHADDPAPLG